LQLTKILDNIGKEIIEKDYLDYHLKEENFDKDF
jgi:hypothetical protein